MFCSFQRCQRWREKEGELIKFKNYFHKRRVSESGSLRPGSIRVASSLFYLSCIYLLDWFWFNFATLNRDVILQASTSENPSISLLILNRSFSDRHLRCGRWLNLDFRKRENIQDGPVKLFTR